MANIFTRLVSLFNKPPTQIGVTVGNMATYPSITNNLYIQTYNTNASVYTIVMLMARKFATLPRYLTEIEDDGAATNYKRIIRHNAGIGAVQLKRIKKDAFGKYMGLKKVQPIATKLGGGTKDLEQLIQFPNDHQGHDSFYQLLYTYKKLTGNAYEWLNRGVSDLTGDARRSLPVIDRWVLPSHLVQMRVDNSVIFGQIVNYAILTNVGYIYFQPEDIIHWKDPNPVFDAVTYDQFYGVSPLQPLMPLIVQDTAGRDAMVAMYQNGGARGVLSSPDMTNLSKEQVAQIDSVINSKINNRDMKSAVAALSGTWQYNQMGDSAVDMELVDAQDKVFQRIANGFGCNPQLFETKTTFNNVEQARKDLITNAILPDACSFRDEENRVLLQAFGLDPLKYCIEIDVTDIAELQEDMALKTTAVMANWTLTVNEKREELGFDPIEDTDPTGEIRFIPNTLTTMEDASVPTNSLTDTGSGFDDGTDSGDPVSDTPVGSTGAGDKANLSTRQIDVAWRKASIYGKAQ